MEEYQKQQLKEIQDNVKIIRNEVMDLKIEQAKNSVVLQEHIRRTEANEKRIQKLEDFKWYFAGIAVLMTAAVEAIRRFL